MKAVIYSRFSTDLQTESSTADQVRVCTEYASRERMQVIECFEDQGISGAALGNRPGVLAMLESSLAKRFDVLLVNDLTRLSRSTGDLSKMIDRLVARGIRVIGVQDGYDTARRGHKLQAGLSGIIGEAFREMISQRTYAALESRAKSQRPTGGKAYGYTPAVNTKAGRVEVDATQAAIVREIFALYADGMSERAIADVLNSRRVPSPGSSWNRTVRRAGGWMGSGVRAILRNEVYAGQVVWNKSEWIKDPDTGVRKRRDRPVSDWVTYQDESMRIVSDELWQVVRARVVATEKASTSIRDALHVNARTGAGPKFLLSGLLKCGTCGSNFVMANATSYRCGSYTNGGKSACGNSLLVSRTLAESKLLAGIKAELMQPEYLEEFKRTVREKLAKQRDTTSANQLARTKRLAELEQQIANMTDAIAAGLLSPALKSKLQAAEAEREQLRGARNEQALAKVADLLPHLTDSYRELVEDLENVPPRQVAKARASLKQLLGDVRLVPENDGLIAEISLDSHRLWSKITGVNNMVAGVGFEPTTFGL